MTRGYKVEGDRLTISKAKLEEWRDHYRSVAIRMAHKGSTDMERIYHGKAAAFVELLKLFEK